MNLMNFSLLFLLLLIPFDLHPAAFDGPYSGGGVSFVQRDSSFKIDGESVKVNNCVYKSESQLSNGKDFYRTQGIHFGYNKRFDDFVFGVEAFFDSPNGPEGLKSKNFFYEDNNLKTPPPSFVSAPGAAETTRTHVASRGGATISSFETPAVRLSRGLSYGSDSEEGHSAVPSASSSPSRMFIGESKRTAVYKKDFVYGISFRAGILIESNVLLFGKVNFKNSKNNLILTKETIFKGPSGMSHKMESKTHSLNKLSSSLCVGVEKKFGKIHARFEYNYDPGFSFKKGLSESYAFKTQHLNVSFSYHF